MGNAMIFGGARMTVPVIYPSATVNLVVTGSGTTAVVLWVNPIVNLNWYNTVIVMKEGSAPTSITDGTEIYRGTGESVNKTGLSYNSTYYFAAFAVNNKGEYDTENFPIGYYKTPVELVLYYDGADPSGLTGGFARSAAYAQDHNGDYDVDGEFSYSTSYSGSKCMKLSAWSENGGYSNYYIIYAASKNKIDFSEFTKIEVTGLVVEGRNGDDGRTGGYTNTDPEFHISTNKEDKSTGDIANFSFTTSMKVHTIDCTNINGSYYMYLGNSSNGGSLNTIYVKKIVAYKKVV